MSLTPDINTYIALSIKNLDIQIHMLKQKYPKQEELIETEYKNMRDFLSKVVVDRIDTDDIPEEFKNFFDDIISEFKESLTELILIKESVTVLKNRKFKLSDNTQLL